MRVSLPSSRELLRRAVPRSARRATWQTRERLQDLHQRAFERRVGISTGGRVYLDDVGLDDESRVYYDGCQWFPVRRALRGLDPGPEDVFVDLGAGRGQAMTIASMLPFGRVLGVELVDELRRDAEANLERAKARGVVRARELEAVTADVLEWPVPGDLTVVFMYCPFTGDVFRSAMERLFASYDRRPRSLHIVYAYPWEHNWLLGTGRVVVEDVRPAQWPPMPWWWRSGWAIVTYRVVGVGQGHTGIPRLRRRLFRPRRALDRWGAPHGHRFKLGRPGHETIYSGPEED